MNRSKEIYKELEVLSPHLNGIPIANNYTVPEGYFDEASAEISSKCFEKKVFDIPEGYFDQMQADVLAKVNKPTKTVRLFTNWNIMGVAASTILLLSVIFLMKTEPANQTETLVDVDTNEYLESEEYLLSNLELFELDDLLTDDTFEISMDGLETEDLEGYMEDNLDDYNINDLGALL